MATEMSDAEWRDMMRVTASDGCEKKPEICACGHPLWRHYRVISSTAYSIACEDCICYIEKEVS